MSWRINAALVLTSAVAISLRPSHASTFSPWEVANVPWGDTLNIRKNPSSGSQKQAGYPNGTILQLTGECMGGVDLQAISHLPGWRQRQVVRYRWCRVWHDPARGGEFVSGWVCGKYITPH